MFIFFLLLFFFVLFFAREKNRFIGWLDSYKCALILIFLILFLFIIFSFNLAMWWPRTLRITIVDGFMNERIYRKAAETQIKTKRKQKRKRTKTINRRMQNEYEENFFLVCVCVQLVIGHWVCVGFIQHRRRILNIYTIVQIIVFFLNFSFLFVFLSLRLTHFSFLFYLFVKLLLILFHSLFSLCFNDR